MERLSEIFLFFTRLGFLGFGGPQAHIALMQDQAQARRGWLTPEEFSDGLAVCNILPGPASTQLATYIGWVRGGGWKGGVAAAVGFIWPAFAIMVGLAWLYFNFGRLPQVNAFFYGLKPVVVAIVLATTWRLAKPSLRDWRFWLIGVVAALLIGTRSLNDFLVFLGAALVGLLLYHNAAMVQPPKPPEKLEKKAEPAKDTLKMGGLWAATGLVGVQAEQTIGFFSNAGDLGRLGQLAWFFVRAGAFIFGGGLVIIPLIQNEIVQGLGWLSEQQFLDGVALGQATPGPVLITAAFVGYAAAGIIGALVATIAIFAPGLTLILLAAPSLQKVRQFPWVRAMLNGVNGAVVGSLVAGAYFVGQTAFVLPRTSAGGLEVGNGKILDFYTVVLGLAALFLMLRYKVNTIYLFLVAGGLGIILSLLPFRLPGSGLA